MRIKGALDKSREAGYREIVEVMRKKSGDPDIFEAGRKYFSHPTRKTFIEDLAKADLSLREAVNLIGQPTFSRERVSLPNSSL
jgi:hypothetical protein